MQAVAEITKAKTWADVLTEEKGKPYFQHILSFVKQQRESGKVIYPKAQDVFNAFKLTSFANIKVVILGQDPYHGPNQAMGLSFSVPKGIRQPPSLQNMFKELSRDLNITAPNHGDLTGWAKQGVLLLNATLTVEAATPLSHANIGWQTFTDKVIECLNNRPLGMVFLLWGSYAQKKQVLIKNKQHVILKTTHPSPLSAHRGFLGSEHFSKANEALIAMDREPIDWQLS